MISCRLKHVYDGDVSVKDTGLGNTLFQLAAQYAFSKKFSLNLNVYDLAIYCNNLKKIGYNHDETIFKKALEYDKTLIDNVNMVIEEYYKEQVYDPKINESVAQNIPNNICLSGYLQSFLYFDEYRNDILDLYSIDTNSLTYINQHYSILFEDKYTCVSIHIRMNYCGINYNRNYFKKAIDYIKDQHPTAIFLIFSNETDLIKDWFNDMNINYIFVKNKCDYLDLWVMSLCKHNIISHSTFSWWGAYLNNNPIKIVTYPNDALRIFWGKLYDTPQNIERKHEHYCRDWIGIESNTF